MNNRKFFKKNIGKEFRLIGTFCKICNFTNGKILVTNISTDKNKKITSHSWIIVGDMIKLLNIGDEISFYGTFHTYVKKGGVRQHGIKNIHSITNSESFKAMKKEQEDRLNKTKRKNW